MIKFTVQGKPKALDRSHTNKGRHYDPDAAAKNDFAIKCSHKRPREPFDFPLHVYLQFHFKNHQSEGDIDNYIKFVFDALNKIFWKDDKCIHRVTAVKVFNGNPRTEVVIMEIDNDETISYKE